MNVKIIADSACDLPKVYYNELNIEMVPLKVHLDESDYLDSKTIDPKTVYDGMRDGKVVKTSQVSPQLFKDLFTEYAKSGQPCVYLAFSSELSGTFQTAKMMQQEVLEEYPHAAIEVLDTKAASLGCGLIVLRAAQVANDGASIEEVVEMANYHANHMEHIFTVDDLEYLYRGGRVSKTQAFVGSLLKIKPLLHVDNGKLIPLEKIRGSKRVLKRMLEVMNERGTDLTNQTVAISHGDTLEQAEALAEMIRENHQPNDIIIHDIGAAIGAHAGPGTIALFFLNNLYK